MKRMLLIAVLMLSACKAEQDRPTPWRKELDPYMVQQGYTLDNNREVIYKNDVPVWYDENPCFRMCTYRYLGPGELHNELEQDWAKAIKLAETEYLNMMSEKLGVKNNPPKEPTK